VPTIRYSPGVDNSGKSIIGFCWGDESATGVARHPAAQAKGF
jgi:hypothetical protein